MKNFILSIILFLQVGFGFSQVIIETGHMDDQGMIVHDRTTQLPDQFHWYIKDDYSSINCYIATDGVVVDTLTWIVNEIVFGTDTYRYEVSSLDGRGYILDFVKGGNSVAILNKAALIYSVMEGAGVYYE